MTQKGRREGVRRSWASSPGHSLLSQPEPTPPNPLALSPAQGVELRLRSSCSNAETRVREQCQAQLSLGDKSQAVNAEIRPPLAQNPQTPGPR